jgi:hypothetical protein
MVPKTPKRVPCNAVNFNWTGLGLSRADSIKSGLLADDDLDPDLNAKETVMKRSMSVRMNYRHHLTAGMSEYLPAPLFPFAARRRGCDGWGECWCLPRS